MDHQNRSDARNPRNPYQKPAWQLVVGLLLLALLTLPVGVQLGGLNRSGAVAAPQQADCTLPTFVDGLSQNVFTATSSEWVRGEAWVEAPFDSDNDGKPDRIHIDITRPPETANPDCNLKVPVIFEDSPYYANLGPSRNWAVDHELGFPPATRAEEPYFTAKNTSPIISTIYESTWLPRGYAVVHAESPGTGLSDGCPTSGGPNETLAGKAVIDWLNGRAPAFTTRTSDEQVFADWTTGKVAMMGTSYNGTLPIAVATTGVEGLDAIVPISAISDWYDYYRANGMVRAPFTYQGEDLDVLADAVYSRADEGNPRTICKPVIANLTANIDRATGDFSDFWNERNYMKDVANVHAAALVAHGNNDFNVMTKNMAQFYEALKAQGVPHQLFFHQGGHGGSPPDVMINRWFTRYLYGVQNGVESLPKAWIVRESNACPISSNAVGNQTNAINIAVTDTSTFDVGDVVSISGVSGTRTVIAIPDTTHLTISGLSTTLSAATPAGITDIRVGSVTNMATGHTITIDSGANLESATIAVAGAGGSTTLGSAAAIGDTNIKVPSISSFSAGDTIWIDTGANIETAIIATVGTPGATTTAAAAAAGATNIKVVSRTGFSVGQTITIDAGANLETRVIQTVGTTGAGGSGITLTSPLSIAHASGVSVAGSGITLTAGLTKAHNSGAAVAGTGLTLTAPLALDHASGAAVYDPASGVNVADGALIYMCSNTYPTPYDEWPDPAAAPATLDFTAGAPGIGGLNFLPGSQTTETLTDDATVRAANSAAAATSSIRLLYKSPVLVQNVRISGTPKVSLWMSFSKPKANLTAVLIDYSPTGSATILTRGWMDPENRNSISVTDPVTPGVFYRMDFDMQPKDSVVVAGHSIGVMILSSDNEATIRPAPGTQLTMDLSQSNAILPVVGGAQALAQALGVVPPTIDYSLSPSNPTGQNGWYTGVVSLTWQIDDGGAALTVKGCENEVFTADGQYERSCEVSNLLGSAGPVSVTVKRDATPPTLAPSVSPNPVLLNGSATASPNASDATSGVATQSCDAVDTSRVGDMSVKCTATDNAGNKATTQAAYNVIYNFSNFFDPVGNPPIFNIANAGQVIPLKWQIMDANGNPILDLKHVKVSVEDIPCTLESTTDQVTEKAAGASGLQNLGDGYYQFNWKTPKTYANSCKVMKLDLGEGTGMERTALFQFVQ